MKKCKSKTCKAFPEACGVWLDAAELRAKKRTNLARPISKLLNPLARSGGYSVAVALNFTQTQMEMPATKQSTISSFFLPQSKKGTDAEIRSSPCPSGMSSTPLPEAHTGVKRQRELIFELPSDPDDTSGRSCLTEPQERDADVKRVSADDEDDDDDKERQFIHLIWGYQSEECEPAGKRRAPENARVDGVTGTRKGSSEDMMHGWTTADGHESLPRRDRTQQENLPMPQSIWASSASLSTQGVCTQEALNDQAVTEKGALFLTPMSTTEIHRTMKREVVTSHKELFERKHQWSPGQGKGKENSRAASPRHSESAPFKQHARSGPAKQSLDFSRKLCRTPKKSIGEARENDKDSFSTLFTQDSEGFRVIAHQGRRSRRPLQDQMNSHWARERFSIPSVRLLKTEENSDPEPEMLFTQDSQGNVVIKH